MVFLTYIFDISCSGCKLPSQQGVTSAWERWAFVSWGIEEDMVCFDIWIFLTFHIQVVNYLCQQGVSHSFCGRGRAFVCILCTGR